MERDACGFACRTWAAVVLMWRYLTYHLYVLVGGLLMPFWLTQTSAHDGPSWRNSRRP